MSAHPEIQEAEYSRSQIQNIVSAVVPKQEFFDAQVELALVHIAHGRSLTAAPHPVPPPVMYTYEHVVPRIESALAELHNEIKDASRVLWNERKDPQQLSPLASCERPLANKQPTPGLMLRQNARGSTFRDV